MSMKLGLSDNQFVDLQFWNVSSIRMQDGVNLQDMDPWETRLLKCMGL